MGDDSERGATGVGGGSHHGSRAYDSPDLPEAQVRREGLIAAHAADSNRLLRALPLDEYALLLPQLTSVRLGLKQLLMEPEKPIEYVYFIRQGVASMIADEQEGGAVEVGTVGPEGLVGVPVLLGGETTPYRVFIQIEGEGWRMSVDAFRQHVEARPVFRNLLLRYTQYFTDMLAQGVACNRLHTVEERCARWLLMTHDRVHGDTFELTHEFLSLMLGVRRAGVTVAMGVLQSSGILRYTRGRILVLDRSRLEEAACGCYRITQGALTRLYG
jgi:CRP-like cAMP-binding protein